MSTPYELPPAIDLLIRELSQHTTDSESFKKRFSQILPELRRTAEWSQDNYPYITDATSSINGFTITPSLGLDPLSLHGKCAAPKCRLLKAKQIARTVGIYADVAIIPDRITSSLLYTKRANAQYLQWLSINVSVLNELRPLLEGGVFRFSKPSLQLCNTHFRKFTSEVDEITQAVLENIAPNLTFSVEDNFLWVAEHELHPAPLNFGRKLTPSEKKQLVRGVSPELLGRKAYTKSLRHEIFEAMISLRQASDVHGVSFSDSRIAMLAARQAEQQSPAMRDIERWEAPRSAVLPWIRDLTIEQIVALRQEARKALPRFRESIATALRSRDVNAQTQVIHDLRAEATEVKSELDALNLPGESTFRGVAGSLGLTIAVYGFAAEFMTPALALGSLISLLGLIHATTHKDHQERDKLLSKPGYVLLKAKELAEHA